MTSTMRIQVVSDLHLEHGNPVPAPAPEADVLIVAGDLAPIKQPWLLAEAVGQWGTDRPILYVPGNHEYYDVDIDEGRGILAGQCRAHGVTLLDRAAVTVEGVRFIGATLWTDFELDGPEREAEAHEAALSLDDFDGAIRHSATGGAVSNLLAYAAGGRPFTTFESMRRHRADVAFIEDELGTAIETNTTAVVVTHHAPTPQSIAPQFEGDPRNAAFASNLEELIGRYRPVLWVHGHVHDPVDVRLGRTRILCNPAGYDARANEQRGYRPQLTVTIGTGAPTDAAVAVLVDHGPQ